MGFSFGGKPKPPVVHDSLKPNYYQGSDGQDLFSRFEHGLLNNPDQVRGFYVGNVMKYITRYREKNGIEDLKKAGVYLNQLTRFEQRLTSLEYEADSNG